jgi:single-strand DNA-binding protein
MNKAILTGRICSDIELKTTQSGVNVCSFRLAVSRKFKNAEGNYDADFISCVAWRSNADFITKYFKKGDPIEVTGSIQTRNYDKDGQTVYVTEVVVDEASFTLSKKQEGTQDTALPEMPQNDGFIPIDANDDLPF